MAAMRCAKTSRRTGSTCGRARLLPSLALARREPRPPGNGKSGAGPSSCPIGFGSFSRLRRIDSVRSERTLAVQKDGIAVVLPLETIKAGPAIDTPGISCSRRNTGQGDCRTGDASMIGRSTDTMTGSRFSEMERNSPLRETTSIGLLRQA